MPSLSAILTRFMDRFGRFKSVPLVTTVVAMILAWCYLGLRNPQYDVSMVVAPSSIPGQTSSKSLLGIGSAADLLGGGLAGGGDVRLQRLQELLTSDTLTARIDANGDIFRTLYASEWQADENRWAPPAGAVASVRRSISEMLGKPPWQPPSAARLAADLRAVLQFSPIGKSDMMRITMRTAKPAFAVRLLSTLQRTADDMLREKEKRRVTAYLGYLNREIPGVTSTENRSAFADLMLEQQRQLMSINATTVSFASEILEAPSIPYKPIGMGPLAVFAMAALIGLLAGLVGVYYMPASQFSPYSINSWKALLGGWLHKEESGAAEDATGGSPQR